MANSEKKSEKPIIMRKAQPCSNLVTASYTHSEITFHITWKKNVKDLKIHKFDLDIEKPICSIQMLMNINWQNHLDSNLSIFNKVKDVQML